MSFLSMTVIAEIMIVSGVVIRYFTFAKIPKKTFVFIWLLVLMRLLIPFDFPFSINIHNYSMSQRAIEPVSSQIVVPNYDSPYSNADYMPITTVNYYEPDIAANHSVPYVFLNQSNVVMWIWGVGMTVIAIYFVVNHIRFLRYVSDSVPVENELLHQLMNKYQSRLKRRIQIRQSQKIVSPMTYGIFSPVILIPKTLIRSELEQLEYILAHEYIHIKRFDCFTKAIATVALCIYWFNPLTWVMYVLLHRDIELSCDEKVLEMFGEQARSTYALTLIDLAEQQNNLSPAHCYFSKHVGIKKRVNVITKMKVNKKSVVGAALSLIFMGGTMVALGAGSSENFANPVEDTDQYDAGQYSAPAYEHMDVENTDQDGVSSHGFTEVNYDLDEESIED